ncbi:uncharacterized protein [Antedon mediterranea]|uniref:uncharacterized protein n=1 Tax=Antedon mediterranea TaxID=105859 RepID=UPI003AF620D6
MMNLSVYLVFIVAVLAQIGVGLGSHQGNYRPTQSAQRWYPRTTEYFVDNYWGREPSINSMAGTLDPYRTQRKQSYGWYNRVHSYYGFQTTEEAFKPYQRFYSSKPNYGFETTEEPFNPYERFYPSKPSYGFETTEQPVNLYNSIPNKEDKKENEEQAYYKTIVYTRWQTIHPQIRPQETAVYCLLYCITAGVTFLLFYAVYTHCYRRKQRIINVQSGNKLKAELYRDVEAKTYEIEPIMGKTAMVY